MGMYDSIKVKDTTCPNCHAAQDFMLQTKDLEKCCYFYEPLPEEWYKTSQPQFYSKTKNFREQLSIEPIVPYDPEPQVWKNQAEKIETLAKPSLHLTAKLKYIEVYGHCPLCRIWLEGKIKVEDGFILLPLYDITLGEAGKEEEEKENPLSEWLSRQVDAANGSMPMNWEYYKGKRDAFNVVIRKIERREV